MQLRGARRRRALDRGFVLSDHADWPGLQQAIAATGAERVYVTHGYVPVMVRWLAERGLDARAFETRYGEEEDDAQDAPSVEDDQVAVRQEQADAHPGLGDGGAGQAGAG
jgi:putative mRNA 3-end processing factor